MKLGASIASAIHANKSVTKASVVLPSRFADASLVQNFSTAFYSDLYSDNRYRTGKKVEVKAESVETVSISISGGGDYASAIQTGLYLARGVSMTKDIVNAPHNILNSVSLANTAKKLALESEDGCIRCEILGKEDCEERGMGAYLGVARGAETEPQFIHLTYKPKGYVKKKVAIVGKGLLFDTGGYNIKTQMMELMKFDCGGAAAVIGAARAIGHLRPEGVEAHFIVAACSNMINSKAVVPSDVLTASNGKTIEVLNTDAEGRLTLADALVYADKELGCESIIELSTLTGACMISLGTKICGVWTENDDLAKSIEEVSKVTGDKSWRMPMAQEYKEQLKSKIADISNLGDR
jgi:leucyl aminopeptidase